MVYMRSFLILITPPLYTQGVYAVFFNIGNPPPYTLRVYKGD